MRAIEVYCSPEVAHTLLAVYRHAERHPSFLGYYFGEGVYPSATAWCNLSSGDAAAVWSIYTGVKKSVLSINFEWMRSRGLPTEQLAKLAAELKVLPGWGHIPEVLGNANFAQHPPLAPLALARPDAADIIIAALNDVLAAEKPTEVQA